RRRPARAAAGRDRDRGAGADGGRRRARGEGPRRPGRYPAAALPDRARDRCHAGGVSMAYHVTRRGQRRWTDVPAVPGLRECVLVGAAEGAIHLEISLCHLAAGAAVPPHLHPYEESWYVLSGTGSRSVAGLEYQVAAGDFGFAGVGIGHAARAGEEPLEWLSVRAPRPPDRWTHRTVPAGEVAGQRLGRPDEHDPRHRFVGHFQDADLAPYGRISMPGYHGPNIRSISVRMLVDALL